MKSIKQMAFDNDNFVGTRKNDEKFRIVDELQNLARQLKALSSLTFNIELRFEDTENTHKNCTVGFQGSRFMLVTDPAAKKIIAEMIVRADDFGVAYIDNADQIRFTFGVRGIWEK